MTDAQKEIYSYLIDTVLYSNHIVTFHMSDAYSDFESQFCQNISRGRGSIGRCQAKMRRYLKKMVDAELLTKPKISGTGYGAYSEFGVRAYGIWFPTDKLISLGKEKALKLLDRRG